MPITLKLTSAPIAAITCSRLGRFAAYLNALHFERVHFAPFEATYLMACLETFDFNSFAVIQVKKRRAGVSLLNRERKKKQMKRRTRRSF